MNKRLGFVLFFLAMLIIPAFCQASVTILTNSNPNHTITSGSDEQVYGTAASNQVTLESGAKAELINFPGQNSIQIQSSSDLFTVSRSGTLVTFQGSDGTILLVPATHTDQTIAFTDRTLTLGISDNQVMLDDQVLDVTPAAISPDGISGPEIVQLIPTGMDSVSIAWMAPASASPAYFTYEIHMDTTDNFLPTNSTLMQSISEAFQTEISGLETGTTYYVLIVAVSQSGTTLPAEEYWQVKTNTVATQLNPDIDLVVASDTGLGVPQVSGDAYVFEKTDDTEVPAEGSILIGEDQEGGYLRKAVSVTDTGSEILVETEQGTFSEAVTTGRVSSNVRLFSPERVQKEQRLSPLGRKQLKSTHSTKADGSPYHRMEWKKKLLTVEEQISPRFEPTPRKGYRKIQLIKESDAEQKHVYSQAGMKNQITLEASLEFEPELRTDVQWHTEWLIEPVIDGGEVIALGTFRADMSARYEFDASYNWGSSDSPNEELLWTRTWTSVYQAGAIPVYQEITMTLTSQAWAAASAEIDTTASAFAQTVIEVGVRYNPNTQKWEAVADTDFDSGLTATLDAEGTVEGEVRLVPNIEVKFYKVVGANMSLEPYTHGLINYTLDASLSGPTIAQFNNFDYLLGLDCNMHLTLWPIFDDDYPLYSAQLYTTTWPIFDLPQLNANTVQTGNEYALTADIQNGTNNTFITDSIKWEVYGPDGNRTSLESGAYDGSGSAVFIPESAGTYQILLSGYGQLGNWVGDIARRYAIIEIESQFDPCTYSIAPHSANFGSGGGSKSVSVTTSSSSCTWTTLNNLPWVTLSPVSWTGNGNVLITVLANNGAARVGSVTIAGKTYSISQAALFQGECVSIAGTWYSSETVTITCNYDGESETDTISESGNIISIFQNECNIRYNLDYGFGTFNRTGTINGNIINFTGPFLIFYGLDLDALGCTVNTNITDITGVVNGNTITLEGFGNANGTCDGIAASCVGSSTATLHR